MRQAINVGLSTLERDALDRKKEMARRPIP
jgi:hypothetical protein